MKTLVLTGITGFIGTNFIKSHYKWLGNYKAVGLVWTKDLPEKVLKLEKVKLVRGDMATEEGIDKLPRKPSVVVNMAANADATTGDYRCNDAGIVNLLKRFEMGPGDVWVQLSTNAMLAGRRDIIKPVDAQTEIRPNNEYGRSKWRGEEILKQAARERGFRLQILRLTTVYGPGAHDNTLFPVAEKMAGGWLSRLDWPGKTNIVSVDRVGDAIVAAVSGPKLGQVVRVVGGEDTTMAEVFAKIFSEQGRVYRPVNLPRWIWKGVAGTRGWLGWGEKVLPTKWHGWWWRLCLICDDVIWTGQRKSRGRQKLGLDNNLSQDRDERF